MVAQVTKSSRICYYNFNSWSGKILKIFLFEELLFIKVDLTAFTKRKPQPEGPEMAKTPFPNLIPKAHMLQDALIIQIITLV